MRSLFLGLVTLPFLLASVRAAAREADLLDFSQVPVAEPATSASPPGPRLEGLGANPFVVLGGVEGSVDEAMRKDLLERGNLLGAEPETNEAVGPVWPEAPTAGVRAAPRMVGGFAARYPAGSFAICEPATYWPTWWLSREVEARRAAYFDLMASVACEHGLPTALLDAVIAQESGYKYWAVSRAGAMGLMQIMPGTARLLGLTMPFNARSNLQAGARYLRQQLDRFGRVDLALAAYNAGPERRSLRAGYVPAIPETLNYVATVTANWSRMAGSGVEVAATIDRGAIAAEAVRAAGYRTVDLSRFGGSSLVQSFAGGSQAAPQLSLAGWRR